MLWGLGWCAGRALALERPVGEDAWRGCDQGHRIALAGGTPRGLDPSRECAAEREGIRRVRVSIERADLSAKTSGLSGRRAS